MQPTPYPLLLPSISFGIGIGVSPFNYITSIILIILCILFLILRIKSRYSMIAIILLFTCLGCICHNAPTSKTGHVKDEYALVAEAELIQIKAKNARLDILLAIMDRNKKKQLVLLKTDTSIFLNPILYATYLVKIDLKKPKFIGNPKDFDYAKYLSSIGVNQLANLVANQPPILLKNPNPFGFKFVCNKISTTISTMLQDGLSTEAHAFVNALLIGNTKHLDLDLKTRFRSLGISHVLAVSGMHVGVLFLIISAIASLFRNKWFELAFSICALWIFAFITGASPSVLRASLVFSLFLVGKFARKRSHPLNALCFAFIILLVFEPNQLYHAGFQLSFLAVCGILSLSLLNLKLANTAKWKGYLVGMVATTLAAQLATTPLSLLLFHNFPIWFLPANMLIVPIIPLLMYLSLAFVVFSKVPFLSFGLAFLINQMVCLIEYIAKFFDQLPYAQGLQCEISFFTAFLLYTSLVFLILFIKHRNHFFLIPFLLLLSASSLSSIISAQQNQFYSSDFIIPAKVKYPAVAIFDQKQLLIYEPEDSNRVHEKLKAWIDSKKTGIPQRYSIANQGALTGSFNKKQWIYLLQTPYKNDIQIQTDILILCRESADVKWESLERINFRILVLDSSVSKNQINRWIQVANKKNIHLHIVSENGAFHLKKNHKWLS